MKHRINFMNDCNSREAITEERIKKIADLKEQAIKSEKVEAKVETKAEKQNNPTFNTNGKKPKKK